MQKDVKRKFIPGKTRIKYGGAIVGSAEKRAINKVLDRNWWTLDEEGRLFEQELARTSGVKHAILTNSGSSALLLAFSILDLPKGSEVIIPATNFPTAVSAAIINGYTPVFVDVDPKNYCIDLLQIEKAITKKTKAVMVVNIAGSMPDLQEFEKIIKRHDCVSILDNCDGYGARFAGKPVETYFDLAVTSFHAAHIITTGEGGAVFVNNKEEKDKAVSIREWGRDQDSDTPTKKKYPNLPEDYPYRYTYITRGFNLRPIELQAAMGRVQLRKLERIKKQRLANFEKIYKGLSPLTRWLSLPEVPKKADPSWFSFPITLKEGNQRKKIFEFLEKRNIETRVIFAGNIIKQPAYNNGDYRVHSKLKNAENVLHNSFFISVHPSLTKRMINYITLSFREFFEEK